MKRQPSSPVDPMAQPLLDGAYQYFLTQGGARAPHTVHVHAAGYRSDRVNTDAYGLRFSQCGTQRVSVEARGHNTRVNVLVGGSTAFGIGASSDAQTVASCLASLTGEVWLTLAGCGLNASQELALFLTHQHRLGPLGHVVVFSGLNTLAYEGLSELLAAHQDQAPSAPYAAFMDSVNQHVLRPAPARTGLWHRLSQALAPRREPLPLPPLSAAERRLAQAASAIGRSLHQWQRLLGDDHTSLTFILQPLLPWCREQLPEGEQAMLGALPQQPAHFDALLEGVYPRALHECFFRRIKALADPVPCYDMNCMLDSAPAFGQTLFCDRLHLNDLGYNAVAKVITAKLGLAVDRPRARHVSTL